MYDTGIASDIAVQYWLQGTVRERLYMAHVLLCLVFFLDIFCSLIILDSNAPSLSLHCWMSEMQVRR